MDGLWIAQFTTGAAHGRGMVIFRNGEFMGGDLSHTYQGEWHEDGANVNARICVTPWPGSREDAPEPFPREEPFMMTLYGSCTEKAATLHGHPDKRPDLLIDVDLQRAA